MEPSKPKITRKTALFPIVGLVAFFLYVYLFQVDIPAIIATAQTADPLPYIAAVLFSLVEVFFYAVSWRTLANFLSIKMSVFKSYLYVWYGIYVDIIVPAESVSGEVTRTYLVTRDQCGPCGKVVASLFTHRLLGMAMNVAVLVLGISLLFNGGQINPLVFNLIVFFAVAITAILILLIIFSFKEGWSLRAIDWGTRLVQVITRGKVKVAKIKEDACKITKSFHDSMREYKNNPKPLVSSLFSLALTWVFSLSIPYLVFLSLRLPVSWSIILITSAIVVAVKSVPIGIPFEVGLPEITMTTLYTSMGVPAGISATATILTRLITLWLRFFIGFLAQQWLELKPVIAPTCNPTTEKT